MPGPLQFIALLTLGLGLGAVPASASPIMVQSAPLPLQVHDLEATPTFEGGLQLAYGYWAPEGGTVAPEGHYIDLTIETRFGRPTVAFAGGRVYWAPVEMNLWVDLAGVERTRLGIWRARAGLARVVWENLGIALQAGSYVYRDVFGAGANHGLELVSLNIEQTLPIDQDGRVGLILKGTAALDLFTHSHVMGLAPGAATLQSDHAIGISGQISAALTWDERFSAELYAGAWTPGVVDVGGSDLAIQQVFAGANLTFRVTPQHSVRVGVMREFYRASGPDIPAFNQDGWYTNVTYELRF